MSTVKTILRFLLSMLYVRVLLCFAFAYPVPSLASLSFPAIASPDNQRIPFEALFPSSPLTKMLAFCMQAYGGLLALRSTCAQQEFQSTSAVSLSAYEKLEQLDACLRVSVAQGQLGALEDVEFLLGVLEKMERVCQLLILCSPSDDGLLLVEFKLGQLQKKLAAVLTGAA
ncbi:hypothetical protein CVU75_01125 [Candidatus Dependentiae bacterium HGW-Dependentiae-1]|nr:MAG: hypothetical protein CVU75_01125 [Candidatus Dependentiae bacterium HGW-Dependentiae-1]